VRPVEFWLVLCFVIVLSGIIAARNLKGEKVAGSLKDILDGGSLGLTALQALLDNSFDSILITDSSKSGKILYANKAFKALTGYSPKEVVGNTPRILQGPATDKKVLDRLRTALSEGKSFEGRAINYKKNGTPFIMHWRVVPVNVGAATKVWVAIQREGSVVE
jgi:PAS domain S-box-containing protein